MLFSSDIAEEFFDYENENDIVDGLGKIDITIKNNNSLNIVIKNNNNQDDNEEEEDYMYDTNLFDIKINYKAKRKYNDLNILKNLYEPINKE